VAAAARSLGIPLALLEPNSAIGLANRLIAPFVQRAYTAFAMAEHHFSPKAVLRSGVPLRPGFGPQPYRPGQPPRIVVLGGSQGAKSLNQIVPAALCRSSQVLAIVHQCGKAHAKDVQQRYASLDCSHSFEVVPFIDDMPKALADADLVVGRSGASAVSEICAIGRASLLVPYPYAASDHQWHNARALEKAGAAVCVAAGELSVERLQAELQALLGSPKRLEQMSRAALELGRPEAARVIASDLLEIAASSAKQVKSATSSRAGSRRGPRPLSFHRTEEALDV
jgi:UDP-N-acetylglucosamine--N-acetylmuramyl-(pentapeptide) pyrophosphoryl-undecaprenol N-acetylglucosamine transferase